jgi:hypothetical protein
MEENQKNEVTVKEVLDHLRITGVYNQHIREVLAKNITARVAKENSITVTDEELQRTADAFRIMNDLENAKIFEDWIAASDLSLEDFENYLERNILVTKFKDKIVEEANKMDYLSKEEIEERVREMVYEDWLKDKLL